MYRVKLDCGRETLITGDHNLWVLRDSELKLIETHEAKDSDYIALPEKLPAPDKDLEWLNLLDLLDGEKMYVDCSPLVKDWIAAFGRAKVLAEFRKHYQGSGAERKLYCNLTTSRDEACASRHFSASPRASVVN